MYCNAISRFAFQAPNHNKTTQPIDLKIGVNGTFFEFRFIRIE